MSIKVITTGEIQYILETLDDVMRVDEALQYGQDASLPDGLISNIAECYKILEAIMYSEDQAIPEN